MIGHEDRSDGDQCMLLLTRVHLSLENLEFTIDTYLQENGSFLDRQTRAMLIGVRENVHRVALSARHMATERADAAEPAAPDFVPFKMLPTGN